MFDDLEKADMRKHLAVTVIFALALAGCEAGNASKELKVATTTSTENTGLTDFLGAAFKKKTGITVHVIAQGTGKALKSGELGNVDVVLVHAKKLEDKFVADGFGVDRQSVMYNHFLIVGPPGDPAGIKGNDAVAAFRKIAEKKAKFCSRGDNSGTHFKEKEIWKEAGLEPSSKSDKWYNEIGKGMNATLTAASEIGAYTLSDSGTFQALKRKLMLELIVEDDGNLYNPYSIIAVNPEKHKNVNYEAAKIFIGWITSPEGQKLIENYKKNGEQLFYPDAVGK